MAVYRVCLTVKDGDIVGFDEAEELIFIDLDTGERHTVSKPPSANSLEDLMENYDPAVLFCREIPSELKWLIEEFGVKVISNAAGNVNEFLNKIL